MRKKHELVWDEGEHSRPMEACFYPLQDILDGCLFTGHVQNGYLTQQQRGLYPFFWLHFEANASTWMFWPRLRTKSQSEAWLLQK